MSLPCACVTALTVHYPFSSFLVVVRRHYRYTQGTQAQSDREDDMGTVEITNRNRIRIRFRQAEEDIPDDFDSSDQEEEHELASDIV